MTAEGYSAAWTEPSKLPIWVYAAPSSSITWSQITAKRRKFVIRIYFTFICYTSLYFALRMKKCINIKLFSVKYVSRQLHINSQIFGSQLDSYNKWRTEYMCSIITTRKPLDINDSVVGHQRSQSLIGLATNTDFSLSSFCGFYFKFRAISQRVAKLIVSIMNLIFHFKNCCHIFSYSLKGHNSCRIKGLNGL